MYWLALMVGLWFSAAAQAITVSPNVQVSGVKSDLPVYETQIVADPLRPHHLLACALRVNVHFETVAYVSSDNGDTWKESLVADPRMAGLDPICVFGLDGTAYVSGLADQHAGLYRSYDGGQTWKGPTEGPNVDRIFYAVDATMGPYRGRIYVFGNGWGTRPNGERAHALEVHVSTDGGESFHAAPAVILGEHRGVNHIGNAVVLSDGTVGVIVADVALRDAPAGMKNFYRLVSSSDGGHTFRSDTISEFDLPGNFTLVSLLPSLAVDQGEGPYRNRLYATWVGIRFGRGEILFSYSRDKGRTWTRPRVISDDPTGVTPDNPGDFTPVVAVNRKGVVGISWYSRREKDIGLGSRLRFTASLDGGSTFLPSVAVSEQPNKPTPPRAPHSVAGAREPERWRFIGGDTAGLTTDQDGFFHALWVDNRTGTSQAWTARIKVTKIGPTRQP
jgi:hypothetical protein